MGVLWNIYLKTLNEGEWTAGSACCIMEKIMGMILRNDGNDREIMGMILRNNGMLLPILSTSLE